MAFALKDRIRETSVSTGTGNFALLGAMSSYRPFSTYTVGDTFWYLIAHQTLSEFEIGQGSYSAANTLTRTTVLNSSNNGAAVAFSAGTKTVEVVRPEEFFNGTNLKSPNGITIPSHAAIGATAEVDNVPASGVFGPFTTNSVIVVNETLTDFSLDYVAGMATYFGLDPTTNDNSGYGQDLEVLIPSTNSKNFAGVAGLFGGMYHYGSGNVDDLAGLDYVGYFNGSGTVNVGRGIRARYFSAAGGTTSQGYGGYLGARNEGAGAITVGGGLLILASVNSGGGTFTNNLGIDIEDQSAVGSTLTRNFRSQGQDGRNEIAGITIFGRKTAPADAVLAASQFSLYLDDTAGAARLKVKHKDSGSTVGTGMDIGTATATSINRTSADLTISTTTSGTITLNSAGSMSLLGTSFSLNSSVGQVGIDGQTGVSLQFDGSEKLLVETGGISVTGTIRVGTNEAATAKFSATSQNDTVVGQWTHSAFGAYNNGSVNNISQIALGFYGATTYAPAAVYLITTSSAGNTKGDVVIATRDVTTDTAPTERLRVSSAGATTVTGTLSATVSDSGTTVDTGEAAFLRNSNGSVNTRATLGLRPNGSSTTAEIHGVITNTGTGASGFGVSVYGGGSGWRDNALYVEYSGTSVTGTLSTTGDITATGSGFVGEDYVRLNKNGSATIGAGPYYYLANAADTRAWTLQLNASNGLTIWNENGAGWTALHTFDAAGGLTLTGTLSTTSDIIQGGTAAGGARVVARQIFFKTGMTDNTATAVITVTVPNAAHAAAIKLHVLGSVTGLSSSATAIGNIVVQRTSGADTTATLATLTLTGTATTGGGEAVSSMSYAASALTGASTATQTFTINFTIDTSAGTSATIQVLAEIQNVVTSGITLSQS